MVGFHTSSPGADLFPASKHDSSNWNGRWCSASKILVYNYHHLIRRLRSNAQKNKTVSTKWPNLRKSSADYESPTRRVKIWFVQKQHPMLCIVCSQAISFSRYLIAYEKSISLGFSDGWKKREWHPAVNNKQLMQLYLTGHATTDVHAPMGPKAPEPWVTSNYNEDAKVLVRLGA